jgi:hypothetical protein
MRELWMFVPASVEWLNPRAGSQTCKPPLLHRWHSNYTFWHGLELEATLKADSHIACRARAVPLPCRAAKGLECVFLIRFTQCGRVWFTLDMPCRARAMLWPCRSSQSHGTARPSRDGLWATCPRSAPSGYHAEFHEDCYQKNTNPPHNDPYLRL